MKKTILLFTLIFSVLMFAQNEKKIKGTYFVKLTNVDTKLKKGILDSDNNSYKDSLISITWNYVETHMSFKLKNESSETIKVNWNDAAMIDINGVTKKIFHDGIKYIDREKEQSPTSIYKESTLSDLLSPIDNVYYKSGKYGGWKRSPLINVKKNFWAEEVYDSELIGKKIKTALPLIINGNNVEYIFEFELFFVEKKQ